MCRCSRLTAGPLPAPRLRCPSTRNPLRRREIGPPPLHHSPNFLLANRPRSLSLTLQVCQHSRTMATSNLADLRHLRTGSLNIPPQPARSSPMVAPPISAAAAGHRFDGSRSPPSTFLPFSHCITPPLRCDIASSAFFPSCVADKVPSHLRHGPCAMQVLPTRRLPGWQHLPL